MSLPSYVSHYLKYLMTGYNYLIGFYVQCGHSDKITFVNVFCIIISILFRFSDKLKSGFITCGVCGVIRHYKCMLQAKKFGLFSCELCRRFILKMIKQSKSSNGQYLKCKAENGKKILSFVCIKNTFTFEIYRFQTKFISGVVLMKITITILVSSEPVDYIFFRAVSQFYKV